MKHPTFFNRCVFLYNLATSFPQNFPSTPRFCAIRKYMNCIPTSRITEMFLHLPHLLSPSTYKSLFETTLTSISTSSNPQFHNDQITKPNPICLPEPFAFACLCSYLYIPQCRPHHPTGEYDTLFYNFQVRAHAQTKTGIY